MGIRSQGQSECVSSRSADIGAGSSALYSPFFSVAASDSLKATGPAPGVQAKWVSWSGENYEEQQRQRTVAALKRRAKTLGFELTPAPVTA
jgi:hypothetical protein